MADVATDHRSQCHPSYRHRELADVREAGTTAIQLAQALRPGTTILATAGSDERVTGPHETSGAGIAATGPDERVTCGVADLLGTECDERGRHDSSIPSMRECRPSDRDGSVASVAPSHSS
jgi:hypothetical protein